MKDFAILDLKEGGLTKFETCLLVYTKRQIFQIKISPSSEGVVRPDFDSFRDYGNAFYFLRNLMWIFLFWSFANSNYLPAKLGSIFLFQASILQCKIS